MIAAFSVRLTVSASEWEHTLTDILNHDPKTQNESHNESMGER